MTEAKWTATQYDAIWAASYSATMVRQIFDFMAEGRGAPDDDLMEGFREEAAGVADMILEK
jgi:hypothetical protein